MSYQVLARKWRPKTFAELSGQEHVVTALTNALSRGRLHHAYLLTGTRGVGKTTIARILAKSLNCITTASPRRRAACARRASTSTPGASSTCSSSTPRRTPASTTCARSSTTRAMRRPSGRYKVYLIDEVHMLSKAAFNSMLKTLEEPPEHVKFVLATTDPQKIPVTVLSRCLQFNLKPLPPQLIGERIAHILAAEGDRVRRRRRGADRARGAADRCATGCRCSTRPSPIGGGEVQGSRRAHDAGRRRPRVRLPDRRRAGRRRRSGAAGRERRAGRARARAAHRRSRSSRRCSIASPSCRRCRRRRRTSTTPTRVAAYATRFRAEAVQLAYQICAQGRADLALAPDEATGFAMTLLRMLAFEPAAARRRAGAARAASARPRRRRHRGRRRRARRRAATHRPANVAAACRCRRRAARRERAAPPVRWSRCPTDAAGMAGVRRGAQADRHGRATGRADRVARRSTATR